MQRAIENWVNWLTVERSASTIRGYRWEMRKLQEHFPEKVLRDFSEADLYAYLAARRKTSGDAAIKRAVNAMRSFFAFALKAKSPAASLKAPRPKKRVQRTLSMEQAFDVLAACDTSSATGVRDLALMCLMLDSGIRSAEVCRLETAKLDLEHRLFTLIVKGGQEAFGVFSAETANTLANWLALRERIARASTATVFVSVGGLKPGQSLTTDGLRRIFHRVGQQAGLAHFSPHDLRRTFATTTTLLGAPSRMSQMWGRWTNLQEFERYTQALLAMQNRMVSEFQKYSPVRAVLQRGAGAEP